MDTEQDFVDEAGPAVEDAAPEPQLIDALPYFDRDMEKVPGTDKAVSHTQTVFFFLPFFFFSTFFFPSLFPPSNLYKWSLVDATRFK